MQAKEQRVSKIEVLGRLLSQDITKQNLIILTEECLASIKDYSDDKVPFAYYLNLKNQDMNENSKWPNLSFEIRPELELSFFINKDVDVFQWVSKNNIYFLEILFDESNENNKKYFWNVLEQCLCSVTKKISLERARLQCQKSSINYIHYLGRINDLQSHVKKSLEQLEEKRRKEEIEKELIKNMKNLQFNLPLVKSLINTEVAKLIFESKGELYNFDSSQDNPINISNKSKVMLKIYKMDSQRFQYALTTETLDSPPLLYSIDEINENLNGQTIQNNGQNLFIWLTSKCYKNIIGNCLSFYFDDIKDIDKLVSSKTDDYQLNYGRNYFPKKVYKGVIYEEGEYDSLVITLGKGLGENWWCVLYPPLCLIDDNNTTSDVEYRSLVMDLISKK